YLNGGDFMYKNKRSRCVTDFLHSRSAGNQKLQSATLAKEFGINHLLTNNLFKEKTYKLDSINKWLSDRQVVFGTKCNKVGVMLLDVFSGKIFKIPNLKSSAASKPPENSCGIHSIEINPSKTLLATGGENANDIAIYKLPTLDPLCVGEGAHNDWTFDIAWLDDEFLVSGSRDSTIALWRVDPENERVVKRHSFPNYYSMTPLVIKHCKEAEKIRAVIFNENQLDIVALSLNAQIHVLDAQTLKQKAFHKLPFPLENDLKNNLYAVGSKSHVSLLDPRTLAPKSRILSKYPGQGTGCGVLLFYDTKADKFIEKINGASRDDVYTKLCATRGYVLRDENYQDIFSDNKPAIYTHQYNKSGTSIFAAGGPLPASLQGNYAALWD
ncbi:WD-repeat protein-like protein, partial [Leptotrombidium deliense]